MLFVNLLLLLEVDSANTLKDFFIIGGHSIASGILFYPLELFLHIKGLYIVVTVEAEAALPFEYVKTTKSHSEHHNARKEYRESLQPCK